MDALTAYGAVAGAATATAAFVGLAAKWDRRLHRAVDVVEAMGKLLQPDDGGPGLAERLRTVEAATTRIEAELQPNHGSSTRDAINRVEQALSDLGNRLPSP